MGCVMEECTRHSDMVRASDTSVGNVLRPDVPFPNIPIQASKNAKMPSLQTLGNKNPVFI